MTSNKTQQKFPYLLQKIILYLFLLNLQLSKVYGSKSKYRFKHYPINIFCEVGILKYKKLSGTMPSLQCPCGNSPRYNCNFYHTNVLRLFGALSWI